MCVMDHELFPKLDEVLGLTQSDKAWGQADHWSEFYGLFKLVSLCINTSDSEKEE